MKEEPGQERIKIFAVRRSTHLLGQFIEVLQSYQIQIVPDIRTVPRSRTNPQFNQETLARELPRAGIRYIHLKELGGLRRPQRDSVNTAWENPSFRGFADYMQRPEFAAALDELVRLGGEGRN